MNTIELNPKKLVSMNRKERRKNLALMRRINEKVEQNDNMRDRNKSLIEKRRKQGKQIPKGPLSGQQWMKKILSERVDSKQ